MAVDNVALVRDDSGNISVWVAGNKITGQKNVQVVLGAEGQTLVLGIPLSRVVFAEYEEVEHPAIETKDSNVIYAFGAKPPEPTPDVDGDAQ